MAVDWDHISKLTDEYRIIVGQVLNVEQFNLFALTHHSTKLEGSTLTQEETNVLLEKGTSIGGRPLEHQNMVLDHQEALEWILSQAKTKEKITPSLLIELASKVMRRTGKKVNSVLGNTDETKGEFRRVNVSAGGYYFVDQSKVVALTLDLAKQVTSRIDQARTTEEILSLAFVSHFDLVSIHPFTDGNGRVSRLLMNYIEAYHHQPLTRVHAEDRVEYIESLKLSRETKDTAPIIEFLAKQHQKSLAASIKSFRAIQDLKPAKGQGDGYSMIF